MVVVRRLSPSVEWHTDGRRPTLWARAYVRLMWLRRDKEAFEGVSRTRRTALDRQREGDAPPTWWTRLRCVTTSRRRAGVLVWTARPRARRRPRLLVVYLHGGGYVHPLTADYWRLVRALTRTPAVVAVPAYPLAPRATVDDVVPRLVRLVEELAAEHRAAAHGAGLVLMGDSAGGALALAVAGRTGARDGARPDAVVALCPWLDAALSQPEVAALESTDPMLAESGLRAAGRWWAGPRSLADPLVSPVEAELGSLPPTEVWIGDRDILRPAVDRFAARAGDQGLPLVVHEVTAMFHVWMTRFLPEARRTRRALRDSLRHGLG